MLFDRTLFHATPIPVAQPDVLAGEAVAVPLYLSPVRAGFPSPADDFAEPSLDFNEYLVKHPAATFCLRVSGNSMEGAGIFDGDLLVVDKSLEPKEGKVVIAATEGRFTCKRLVKEKDRFYLVADHPDYPPLLVTEETEIWGVVTHVLHSV